MWQGYKGNTRVIVIVIAVLFIVKMLSLPLSVVFGFLPVQEVETLRLGQLIDFGSRESRDQFLRKGMTDLSACRDAMEWSAYFR